MIKHCITTTFGAAAIAVGIWSLHVHWISYQSVYFNLVYAGAGPLGLIVAGAVGIFSADGRHVK